MSGVLCLTLVLRSLDVTVYQSTKNGNGQQGYRVSFLGGGGTTQRVTTVKAKVLSFVSLETIISSFLGRLKPEGEVRIAMTRS